MNNEFAAIYITAEDLERRHGRNSVMLDTLIRFPFLLRHTGRTSALIGRCKRGGGGGLLWSRWCH
jgi:hypothetical protein